MTPLAWAILNASDEVIGVERSRVIAEELAALISGAHIKPLVLGEVTE